MNNKKASYLSERIYKEPSRESREKLEYWLEILGKNSVKILKQKSEFAGYLGDTSYNVREENNRGWALTRVLCLPERECVKLKERICRAAGILFPEFYLPIIEDAVSRLNSPCIQYDFAEALCRNLQSVCMRTLIMSMHKEKAKGNLKGTNPREEYLHFCREILTKEEYVHNLFEEYPVLLRCIEETVSEKITFFSQVLNEYGEDIHILREKGIVECKNEMPEITGVESNFSDTHKKGKQVLKFILSNGQKIIYKPRSMENERLESQLLKWLEAETGIQQKEYAFYSTDTHSWCAVVEDKTCNTEEELKLYYERMGVQLFAAYILGTKDLHSENVIASGAYPVLIDLETLVNIPEKQKRETADQEILYQLSYSVLYTGLLPFYHWGKDGKGVDMSGVSGRESQVYPFKVPVVTDLGTSDMRIEYQYPKTEKCSNQATLNGEFKGPHLYKKEMEQGFQKSYKAVTRKKQEFMSLVVEMASSVSRYLVADTQRYSMQLAGSYHPLLLQDGADREIFLNGMWGGRDVEDEKTVQVVESEIKDLLHGDIPYFTYRLNSTSLFGTDGEEIAEYFREPAIEVVKRKIQTLDDKDMQIQSELIRTAMELMQGAEKEIVNGIYNIDELEKTEKVSDKEKRKALRKVTDRILDAAIYNRERTDVSWYGVQLHPYSSGGWQMSPMNMYFYSGIAGMAVLFHKIASFDNREQIKDIAAILDEKLFSYTRNCKKQNTMLSSKTTGMYEGETSVVYAYINIYKIENDERYLEYAEEHCQIVEILLEEDKSYDLLTGNAGAADVFMQLYELTHKKEYLEATKRAAGILLKAAVKQEKGIGWITEAGLPPMAGMAHGNSGIVIPFARLWKYTGEEQYLEDVKEILEYENSLYDETIHNWRDMRAKQGDDEAVKKDKTGAVAWCHGAAGILMSRCICLEYLKGTMLENIVKQDIERARTKLEEYPVRNSWSLCHGTCGNMQILKRSQEGDTTSQQEEIIQKLEGFLVRSVLEDTMQLLPQEKMCFGMMNGWGGIAWKLTEKIEKNTV